MTASYSKTHFAKKVAKQIRRAIRPSWSMPNWNQIIQKDLREWERYKKAALSGPKILIATSTGGNRAVAPVESLLTVALTLRGANVHTLLCDTVLPACQQATIEEFWSPNAFAERGPSGLCRECFEPSLNSLRPLGLPIHRYSELITHDESASAESLSESVSLSQIPNYRIDGVAIGEHAYAGALRFFARGEIESEPLGAKVLRRYFHASLLTFHATRRLLADLDFKSAVFHHGIYIPQGTIGEVARSLGVEVINWNPAYRKQCFVFSRNDTYHHTLLSEPTEIWEDIDLTEGLEAKLMDYLDSRRQGSQDWIWFHERPEEDLEAIAEDLGIDFSKTSIGLLTNVVWDAQLHYPANALPNMIEWVMETIRYFASRPELQLVIRIHPAEVRGTLVSRQPMEEQIRRALPALPSNVVIIPPESNVSTYAVMSVCDSIIIYGTKMGVELTSLGIPVIVAGEAWIRNKGLTMDADSPEEYWALLDRLPIGHRMDSKLTHRARKYAYHFFFRRMIPIEGLRPQMRWPPYRLELASIADTLPGKNPGLDVICDGILHGGEFVYPDERL